MSSSPARSRIPISQGRRIPAAVLALLAALLAVPAAAQEPPPRDRCATSPEFRQLDFWIGTWDVYDPETGEKAGVNVIEPLLNRCALLESWTGEKGGTGKSLNFFDPQRKTWRQVWVSDRGSVLDYREGERRGDAMHFRGITIDPAGDTTLQRLTFRSIAPDTVRQIFQASKDGGTTWDTTWVGVYIRR